MKLLTLAPLFLVWPFISYGTSYGQTSIPEDYKADTALISTAPDPDPDQTAVESAGPSHTWAFGLNLAWLTRRDYGAKDYRRFSPELMAYRYGELPWVDCYWRAGARLGFARGQPEMPRAVRIEESDTTVSIEGGLLREWHLVPSISWGLGYDFRTTKIKTSAPIDTTDDRFNRKERLMFWYLQSGIGLPLYSGMFMIEPVVRYQSIEFDDRSRWLLGFETTFGF